MIEKFRLILLLPARTREYVLPVTIEAVILAVGLFTFLKMPPQGTMGDIFSWSLSLIAFCLAFSIFPAIAILVGWYTGNRVVAFLAGAFPLPFLYGVMYLLISAGNMVFIRIPETVFFIGLLSVICGFAGYCAAWRTKNFLALSIVFTGIWLIVWMSGFN